MGVSTMTNGDKIRSAKQIFSRIGIRYDDWEFQVDGQISMEALKDGKGD